MIWSATRARNHWPTTRWTNPSWKTNRRLAACGLQQRNDEDAWQLTAAGRDWGQALPSCSRGHRGEQILWDPAVLAVLREDAG